MPVTCYLCVGSMPVCGLPHTHTSLLVKLVGDVCSLYRSDDTCIMVCKAASLGLRIRAVSAETAWLVGVCV